MSTDSMAQVEIPTETETDWVFTFGAGHRGFSRGRARPDDSEPIPGGFRLDDRYVVIKGTFASARERMVAIFGQVWSMQYESVDEAGVDDYHLTELVLTDDWEPSS